MVLENLFYIRESVRRNGKKSKIYKIRTMVPDAEKYLDDVVAKNGLDDVGNPKKDYRITRLGKFLRKYWIDEIPQIFNLVIGDLKLVGVRPRSEKEWEFYPESLKKHALKYRYGLFGANYANANRKCFEDAIRSEEEYLRQKDISPTLTDVRYFFKILWNILFRGVRSR